MTEPNGITRRHLLRGALGTCATGVTCATPLLGTAPVAAAGLPVLLARDAPADIDPAGHLVSEKLDGVRALWDGARLRFRGGSEVAAPAWWRATLPAVALDGELWLARGRFDALSAAVRRAQPLDEEWRRVRYAVFDRPGEGLGVFAERAAALPRLLAGQAHAFAVEQQTLADNAALQRRLRAVVSAGGEGLMLHRADAHWHAGRHGALLKLKPIHDAEARVLAHVPGRGRLAGRMGALEVETPAGVRFRLGSGFSDETRAAAPAPGSIVTYTHRGHTAGGVPRFASFLRVREPGV